MAIELNKDRLHLIFIPVITHSTTKSKTNLFPPILCIQGEIDLRASTNTQQTTYILATHTISENPMHNLTIQFLHAVIFQLTITNQ